MRGGKKLLMTRRLAKCAMNIMKRRNVLFRRQCYCSVAFVSNESLSVNRAQSSSSTDVFTALYFSQVFLSFIQVTVFFKVCESGMA